MFCTTEIRWGMINYKPDHPEVEWHPPYQLQDETSLEHIVKKAFSGYENFYIKTLEDGVTILCYAKPDKQEELIRIFQ